MATPATPVAMLISTAIVAGISGYLIGIATSLGLITNPFRPAAKREGVANYDNEDESTEEEVDDLMLDHAPNWTAPTDADTHDEECKLVLIVRTDLGMTKGKIAAQCSHATLACYKHFLRVNPASATLRRWERQGQAKIALQVRSEEELATLQATARSLGLVAEVIADAGRTQIASGSHTVLGIGPAPKSIVDQVTGNLKLL
ncbi:hypothetical protein K3495_g639 [Podosphaera aphanis]|nr:hypothetical protein K3495_g639 [Podosphaera aphanis]